MKKEIVSLFVGLIFSIGLGIAGMTQPQKVIGFLDFFNQWDPSLLFVMVGAIFVHSMAYHFIIKRNQPILDEKWAISTESKITKRLVVGSMIFGVGWGLAGYCPGPALTSLASGQSQVSIFVLSMFAGMILFKVLSRFFST